MSDAEKKQQQQDDKNKLPELPPPLPENGDEEETPLEKLEEVAEHVDIDLDTKSISVKIPI